MEQRRQEVRKQRIRVAQIEQSAANTGVAGSSGEFGSVSGLQTSTASNLANISMNSLSAAGISRQNQRSADAQMKGQIWGSVAQIGGMAMNLGIQGGALSGFGSSGIDGATDNMINANPNIFD